MDGRETPACEHCGLPLTCNADVHEELDGYKQMFDDNIAERDRALTRYEALVQAARDAHVYHRCPAATGGAACELCVALAQPTPPTESPAVAGPRGSDGDGRDAATKIVSKWWATLSPKGPRSNEVTSESLADLASAIAAALESHQRVPSGATPSDAGGLLREHFARIAEEAKVPPGERLGDECCTSTHNAACQAIASAIRMCDHCGAS